jgi:hypothetical protein
MDDRLKEFFTSRDFYEDLAEGGKKFYKKFVHYLRDNIDKVEEIKSYLLPSIKRITSNLEFWVSLVRLGNDEYNRVNYIHTVLEFRRYYIMYDVIMGYKFEKYDKFSFHDSVIAKLLSEGKLDEFLCGKPVELTSNTNQNQPPPSNTNRPPLGKGFKKYIYL